MNSQKKIDCLHRSQEGCKMETYYRQAREWEEEKKSFIHWATTHIRNHFILVLSLSPPASSCTAAAAVMSRAYHRQIQQTKTLKAMRLFDTKHLLFHRFFMFHERKNILTHALFEKSFVLEEMEWNMCTHKRAHGECAFFRVT